MSQNDLVIANQSAPDFRSDLNDALQALGSLNSGSTAPSTTYANMLWYDTSNNILKMRSEADDAWISLGTLNQSTNEFEVANLTELTQTQVEDDTDTTFGLVTGERLAQAVAANASGIGVSQTWQDVSGSRSGGSTSYQNTTDQTIVVVTQNNRGQMQVSDDNSTWVALVNCRNFGETIIVPPNYYYRFTGSTISLWVELR